MRKLAEVIVAAILGVAVGGAIGAVLVKILLGHY